METSLFDRTTPPQILTLVLVAALASMTMNIFLPSLPAMAEYFGTSHSVMQYAISGYLFMCGFVQLVIGPLADRFGRRPVLLSTIALFALASLGATVAPNVETFMVCRVLQTSMVSGLVLSRTIARDMVGPTRAASLIGYITMCMALVPTAAPVIGGVMQELFGWTANFLLQAGIALATLLLVYFDLGETGRNRPSSFSDQVRQFPELFRSRRFWGYSLTCAFSTGTFFAYLGGGPFIAAQVYELEPGQIGLYFTFAPIGYLVGNGIAGKFSVRFGRQRMVVLGTTVIASGMAAALLFQALGATHPLSFFAFTVFIGLGNGLALPSANAGMLMVRPELAGAASGLGGSLTTLGGGVLAIATGNLLALGNNTTTMLLCILAPGVAAVASAIWTVSIERRMRNT